MSNSTHGTSIDASVCLRKRCYLSRAQARSMLKHLRGKYGFSRCVSLKVYRCCVCGKFHLGRERADDA